MKPSALNSAERRLIAQLRPSPRANPGFQVRRFGDDSEQPIRFYLFTDVLEELAFSAGYDETSVCAAVLLGGFGMEDEGGFVEVSGFDGLEWVGDPEELYPVIRETCDERLRSSDDDAVVGLFVASAGCQGRIDPEVARVHFSLMNIPFQPLIVFDPAAKLLGVYARPPGEPFFEAAYRAVAAKPTLNASSASGTPSTSEE